MSKNEHSVLERYKALQNYTTLNNQGYLALREAHAIFMEYELYKPIYGVDEWIAAYDWLTPNEAVERLQNEIDKGRIVESTREERDTVDRGEFYRVSTWAICGICGLPNVSHPYIDYQPFLHRLCDGTLGKT